MPTLSFADTTIQSKFFFDTNIFIYSVDRSEPKKRAIANQLIRSSLDNSNGAVSYQVIQEFLNTSLKKFAKTVNGTDSLDYLREVFEPMLAVESSLGLFDEALVIYNRYKLSWYDSLIVAAAIKAKCDVLYTEDLQHGQRFGDLVVTNPFL
jgi:predicted nucleic acid-binding protein